MEKVFEVQILHIPSIAHVMVISETAAENIAALMHTSMYRITRNPFVGFRSMWCDYSSINKGDNTPCKLVQGLGEADNTMEGIKDLIDKARIVFSHGISKLQNGRCCSGTRCTQDIELSRRCGRLQAFLHDRSTNEGQ